LAGKLTSQIFHWKIAQSRYPLTRVHVGDFCLVVMEHTLAAFGLSLELACRLASQMYLWHRLDTLPVVALLPFVFFVSPW